MTVKNSSFDLAEKAIDGLDGQKAMPGVNNNRDVSTFKLNRPNGILPGSVYLLNAALNLACPPSDVEITDGVLTVAIPNHIKKFPAEAVHKALHHLRRGLLRGLRNHPSPGFYVLDKNQDQFGQIDFEDLVGGLAGSSPMIGMDAPQLIEAYYQLPKNTVTKDCDGLQHMGILDKNRFFLYKKVAGQLAPTFAEGEIALILSSKILPPLYEQLGTQLKNGPGH